MKRIIIWLAAVVLIMGCLGTAYALLIEGGQPGVPDLETLRQIYEARQNGMDMWVEDTIMPPTALKTWDDYVKWREDTLGGGSFYDPNVITYAPVTLESQDKAAVIAYLAKALGIVGGTGGIEVINAVSNTPLGLYGYTSCLINLKTADGRIYQVQAGHAVVPNATWEFTPVNFGPVMRGSFRRELRDLRGTYLELIQGVEAAYEAEAGGIKEELNQLKAEQQEMIDAVKEAFKETKKDLETELSKLKTEQTEKLTVARNEFIDSLKKAIKEGRWKDIIGVIKEYMSKRSSINSEYKTKIGDIEKQLAGLNDEEKNAIAAIEEQYRTKITELEDKLAGLNDEKKQALDALRASAEEEIRALCAKYGILFRQWYVDYVFRNTSPPWKDTDTFRVAPLNPAFVEYMKNPNAGEPIGYDKDGNPLYGGYVPPTVDLSHLNRIPVKKDNNIRFVPQMGGTKDTILSMPEK